ncbi:hypothetical protein PU03_00195 [Escherichia coli]|nr:hypothetical protein PU03_00195 [Escherichia coli]
MCGEQSPHIRLSGQDGKAPALHFRPRSVMAAGDFVLRAMMSFADRSPKQDSLYKYTAILLRKGKITAGA